MGPGDRAFIQWVNRLKCHVTVHDAKRVLLAYKKANLIAVDNRNGTFRVLDFGAVRRDALEAAAENLRPRSKKWNDLTDDERQKIVASKCSVPEQWERQERVELAIAKLDAKRKRKRQDGT